MMPARVRLQLCLWPRCRVRPIAPTPASPRNHDARVEPQPKESEMRIVIILALILANSETVFAQGSASNPCKVCSDQQAACMKNYAGPTCKTEYQICMKSCRKK